MKLVPDEGEDITEHTTDYRGDDNKNYGRGNIEGLDGVDGRNKMHLEDEINECLRIVECY